MAHAPDPNCRCVHCVTSRKQRFAHRDTCMCPRCRQIKGGVKIHVIVPERTLDRIEGYVRVLGTPRPDIMREALELWLKVADYKREERERGSA